MLIRRNYLHALLLAFVLSASSVGCSWDFAVTTKSKIIFFNERWKVLTTAAHQFDELSALTFDETEELLYFNDQKHNNGSIFSLKLPTTFDDRHIIDNVIERTQNETIAGIAYDPLNRNLYWSDKRNKKIYFISIDNAVNQLAPAKILIDFADEDTLPDGIALDICRRKLYWTNSDFRNASIERIDLDGTNREVLVRGNLFLPHGIVIDQLTDRIYYVVDQPGVHFTIESTELDGSNRIVIVQGQNHLPQNLAVTKDGIFWTDATHNSIWSHAKFITNSQMNDTTITNNVAPNNVMSFVEQPRGIVARQHFLTNLQNDQHCAGIVNKLRTRLLRTTPRTTRNPFAERLDKLQQQYCLNDGEFSEQSGVCICKIGYKGVRCETSECHNYCVHGTCSISSLGLLKCNCQKGFYGERCQFYKCAGYCFNDGQCSLEDGNGEPTCNCKDNFGGERCEQNSTEICALFCRILKYEPDMYVPFGCHDICEKLSQDSENGLEIYAIPKYTHLEICRNTVTWNNKLIIILVLGVVTCCLLMVMFVHGLRRFYKPARPRIRKTFVVRKRATNSDTPLTNRPIATEQCEITIENCCNMNICDTPCFDPKLMQQSLSRDGNSKDDKKYLIQHMEDELY